MFKLFVLLMLAGILYSLFSGLYYLIKNQHDPDGSRLAKALTLRIALSLSLFVILILVGYFFRD